MFTFIQVIHLTTLYNAVYMLVKLKVSTSVYDKPSMPGAHTYCKYVQRSTLTLENPVNCEQCFQQTFG